MANNALKSTDITGTLSVSGTSSLAAVTATTVNATGIVQSGDGTAGAEIYAQAAAGSNARVRFYNGATAANAGLYWIIGSEATTFGWNVWRYITGTFQEAAINVANATGFVTVAKGFISGVSALTDAATIATDASLGNTFTVTLGGSRTMGAPTNATNGQVITYRIRQDGTGSRTITWNAIFRFSTTRASPTLSTGANKVDYVSFQYNSTDTKWDVINIDLGH